MESQTLWAIDTQCEAAYWLKKQRQVKYIIHGCHVGHNILFFDA